MEPSMVLNVDVLRPMYCYFNSSTVLRTSLARLPMAKPLRTVLLVTALMQALAFSEFSWLWISTRSLNLSTNPVICFRTTMLRTQARCGLLGKRCPEHAELAPGSLDNA